MPFVEEEHLVDIHRHLEEKEISEERLARELRKQRMINNQYRRANNRLAWTLIVVCLVLLSAIGFYLMKPFSGIDESPLHAGNEALLNDRQLLELQEELVGKSEEANELREILETLEYRALDDEVVYTVQVAALVNEKIPLVSEELLNLNIYKDLPYNKYALGQFTKVEDAEQLRKALLDLGFKDAFIVSYKNGKRLKIIDPLVYE